MKRQLCQAKSSAKSWDELIEFTEAKIKELKDAVGVFRRCKKLGDPWPGTAETAGTAVKTAPANG